MTDAGSEFLTDGAAHQKECFSKSVRANSWMSSDVAVERSVRALTRRLMRWLRYCGTDVFRVLYQSLIHLVSPDFFMQLIPVAARLSYSSPHLDGCYLPFLSH